MMAVGANQHFDIRVSDAVNFSNVPTETNMSFRIFRLFALIPAIFSHLAFAESMSKNSNVWPVYRDDKTGFFISQPPNWITAPTRGRNVKFSVVAPDGPGNCNVVVSIKNELKNFAQSALSQEIESLPLDQESWAEYMGTPKSQLTLIESRLARIHNIPAIIAVVETGQENLEGKFSRKQMVALTFTPGLIWTLNCGVSTFKKEDAEKRYTKLQPEFNKVFGSFGFSKPE